MEETNLNKGGFMFGQIWCRFIAQNEKSDGNIVFGLLWGIALGIIAGFAGGFFGNFTTGILLSILLVCFVAMVMLLYTMFLNVFPVEGVLMIVGLFFGGVIGAFLAPFPALSAMVMLLAAMSLIGAKLARRNHSSR